MGLVLVHWLLVAGLTSVFQFLGTIAVLYCYFMRRSLQSNAELVL